jgi:hypothetical protein
MNVDFDFRRTGCGRDPLWLVGTISDRVRGRHSESAAVLDKHR